VLLAGLPRMFKVRVVLDEGPVTGAFDPACLSERVWRQNDPARVWTIPQLAREVGLSRSRHAERLQRFLGESPMSYLAHWRLRSGVEILQTDDDSVAQIAAAVGYGSEAAFNRAFNRAFKRAFKREFACPPARFRREHADYSAGALGSRQ
jgi:AraC-like DNA-binding protein